MLRIKEITKSKDISLKELAKEMGIEYGSLYRKLKRPTLETLTIIAKILNVEIHELIQTSDKFKHLYDDDGVWYGISHNISK